ncbi:terminase large subunit domain-containing protein [Streptomyces sp. NPDC002754]
MTTIEEAELRAMRRQYAAHAAMTSPAKMGRYVIGRPFHIRAHTKVIDDELSRLTTDSGDRLLITTPPQIGKSTLVSELLPLWWLAHHPRHRVSIASYAASLAVKKGRAVRQLAGASGAAFGLHLQAGAQEVYDWSLTTDGGVRSVGIGGGLTGHSSHLGIVDDPHKDRAEADSPLMRQKVWDWWSSVFLSRLKPGAPIVMILTRWSEDDLAARVLHHEGRADEGGRWRVLDLEAIASGLHPDPLGRAPGAPLTHPEIDDDDREALLAHWEDKRRTSTPRDWAALYMGRPTPAEGGLVDAELMRQRTHLAPPPATRSAVAIDPSGGGHGDTAGIVAGHLADDGKVYLTHDRTGFMSSDKWARKACLLAIEVDADRICYETNFGGDLVKIAIKAAWDALQQEGAIEKDRMRPYLHGVHARKGKLLRGEPIAQAIREDNVRLGAQLPELVAEWCQWTADAHMSPGRIDASVYLVKELMPPPGAARRGMQTAAGVSRDQFPAGTQQPRRPY